MPIDCGAKLKKLSQAEFAAVSYKVMAEIFGLQRELGRLFDEKVYKNALQSRMKNLQTEVEIKVSFRDFQKSYFMDVLASSGAVFELKAIESINQRHRSQLLNYLLMCDLKHGKLVNLRSDSVDHEFVNATQSLEERQTFIVDKAQWRKTEGFGSAEQSLMIEMVRDWGTGLERALYEEALIHFKGGLGQVKRETDVVMNGRTISTQPTLLCGPETVLKVTTFENNTDIYQKDLSCFLTKTSMEAIQWINISRKRLSFKTII